MAKVANARQEMYRILPNGEAELNLGNHPGQTRVWRSPARFILMLSGTQGGKTSFGPWWLWNEIKNKGAGDYLAATTNYDLFKLKMLPEIRKVFEKVLGKGRYWPGDKVMELKDPVTNTFWANHSSDPMWGRIILRSAEAPAGLESATAKAAWLDEVGMDAWDVTLFEAILRRLSIAQGRLLGTTTVYNAGWIKTEWYDKWVDGDPDYDVVQFSSTVNPSFPQEEYDRAQASMPEWRFGMFYDAEFTRPEGLIYAAFRDKMFIPFDETVYAPHVERIVGVDPGGANNASIYIIHDTDVTPSRFYVYDEYLEGGMSTKELTGNAKERTMGLRDVKWIGGASGETQFRMDWNAGGIPIFEPSVSDVESGIANVIELFKTKRLFISRKCKGLRHELTTYRRKLLPDGTVTENIERKNEFHRLDALRYALGSPVDAGWTPLRDMGKITGHQSKWGEGGRDAERGKRGPASRWGE